ncbi:MAG: phytanoyl-CoA dioxygenase family protein [Actinomycetota bacterium]
MRALERIDRTDWAATGVAVLRGALAPDVVAELDRWTTEVETWAREGGPGLHHFEQTSHGAALARSEDVVDHHAGLERFLRDGPVAPVLAELFSEAPILFKEKVNYKQPGGAGFAPHQDATAYRFVDHHLSVAIPLDPATERSGCLWFADWFEPRATLPHTDGRIAPEWCGVVEWRPVELDPGDVVVFDSYAPHRSETNHADRARRTWYVTYNAESAGDWRDRYYADKRALLDEVGDGDTARISVNDDFLGIPVTGD